MRQCTVLVFFSSNNNPKTVLLPSCLASRFSSVFPPPYQLLPLHLVSFPDPPLWVLKGVWEWDYSSPRTGSESTNNARLYCTLGGGVTGWLMWRRGILHIPRNETIYVTHVWDSNAAVTSLSYLQCSWNFSSWVGGWRVPLVREGDTLNFHKN